MLLTVKRNELLSFNIFIVLINCQALCCKFSGKVNFAFVYNAVFPVVECLWYYIIYIHSNATMLQK